MRFQKMLLLCCAYAGAGSVLGQPVSGLIEPINDIEISAPIPGRVSAIHFKEGERVSAGAVVLELDARMELLEIERRRLIYEDRAELEAARARRELLSQDLEALRSLFERTGSVSREELSRKELEHTLAGLDVRRLEQAKLRENIEYQMAQEQRKLRLLEAPFDGVVASLYFDEGESVQANQPLLRLVADERGQLVVNLPAERLGNDRVGTTARIRVLTQPPIIKEAVVTFISPIIDASSGLREIKLEFDNNDPRVEPGTTGQWLREAR
jgi:RND family efflux transporter MFP subunit